FRAEQVGRGHPHVGELHLTVAEPVDVPEHRQIPQHGDAGRVGGHQDHALAAVIAAVRVGGAHEDHQLAVLVQDPGGPPLAAVEHQRVTVPGDGGGDVASVR